MFRNSFAAALMVALLPVVASAQPGSESERKRLEIEQQLNLPKNRRSPPPPEPETREVPETPEPAAASPTPTAGSASTTPVPPLPVVFVPEIERLLQTSCRACHAAGGPAGMTRMVLKGEARADYQMIRGFVDTKKPKESPLLLKSSGQLHGGGPVFVAGSRGQRRLLSWISAGALFEVPASGAVPVVVAPVGKLPRRPRGAHQKSSVPVPVPLPAAVPVPEESVAADPSAAPPPGPNESIAAQSVAGQAPTGPTVLPKPLGPNFVTAVEPILVTTCRLCHSSKGLAALSHLSLTGDPVRDHAAVLPFVNVARPGDSALVTKAAGTLHGGGALLPATSAGHRTLMEWIKAGAHGIAPPAPVAPVVAAANGPSGACTCTVVAPLPPPPSPPPPPPPPPPPHEGLPLGLQVNGRFDLNYERRGLGRDTSFAEGKSVLRSYHQFLFLSRAVEGDPIGFMVEAIGLQLWEGNFRHRFNRVPVTLMLHAGKILVPFGNDPLFHQAYGGLAGFDQKVLPPIWAQEGATASVLYRHNKVSLTGEAYAVRGYRLKQATGVLNLQSDFSSSDDIKPGFGSRVGFAMGPFTAYYSAYFNPLGFDRHLFMQAADLSLWRVHGIPILDRLALGAGLLRADVAGGGAGADYFHFASYYQVRGYITDALYLQYRQGLRTFNNRRGVYIDRSRLDSDDASTHTLALVARYHGLSVGVAYFLNFEKANEVDDDFFRVNVAYEF